MTLVKNFGRDGIGLLNFYFKRVDKEKITENVFLYSWISNYLIAKIKKIARNLVFISVKLYLCITTRMP